MSDQNSKVTSGQPQLRVLTQYVKDLSFENPNAPRSLAGQSEAPQIEVRVDVGVQRLATTDYEVAIHVAVEAKAGSDALFMVELDYAGLFRLENVPEADVEAVLVVECPRQIFPFARRIIADATRDGGFPPLMLDPIDFMALYQQRLDEGRVRTTGDSVN